MAQRLREEVDRGRRAGEIAVLVRAAASLRLLEQALEERGLATYVVGGRGYWSQEQVRDGLAYLSVLANPLDETALYAVLASPFGGLGADGLVLTAQAGKAAGSAWAALRARARVGGRRSRTPTARRWTASCRCWPPSARRPSGCPPRSCSSARSPPRATTSRCSRGPGGERRLANLRKLMRLAREYERAEGRDLRAFLAFARTQDLAAAREGEAAMEGEGLDAVRLMTIHRAKGLEFPVVCVADLGRQGPGGAEPLLLGRDGRIGLRLRSLGVAGRRCRRSTYAALDAERAAARGRGGAAAAVRRDDAGARER